jgi:hypothetical protein
MKSSSSVRKCNTDSKNCVEFPVRLLKFILKKMKIRPLLKQHVKDPRKRTDCYELDSLLMHAMFTHLFRSPSKNKFRLKLTRPCASRALAKFNGINGPQSPSVRTIDKLLLKLNPEDFGPILPELFRTLCRQKVFKLHPEFIPLGEYTIAIDAQVTHTYHDLSQHPCESCPYCLKRTRGNKVWYLHLDLVATFVTPTGFKFSLLAHRVRARPEWGCLSDGEWKQECERTAFPFLVRELRRQFPRLHLYILLDALYATDPILTLLNELKMGYSIVRKVKVLKTVGQDCEGLKVFSKPVKVIEDTARFTIRQTIYFFNDVAYRDHKLSIIQLDERAEKKPSNRKAKILTKSSHWEWIVAERLNARNVYSVASESRMRWKQEDLFNELQCRGYAINHDFNRDPKAQSVRMYLILIAHAICSILTHSTYGRSILAKKYTIRFMMEQMLNDLIYIPASKLFALHDPMQLRFAKDPPLKSVRISA